MSDYAQNVKVYNGHKQNGRQERNNKERNSLHHAPNTCIIGRFSPLIFRSIGVVRSHLIRCLWNYGNITATVYYLQKLGLHVLGKCDLEV